MKSRKITYFKYLNLFFAMVILVFINGCTGISPVIPIINGPAGGYIFYDKGGYSDGWRFLEVAPLSTEWTEI